MAFSHSTQSDFRTLRIGSFRSFWIGQLVSSSGAWAQAVAQAWLVLELTNSSLYVGLTVALQLAPALILRIVSRGFPLRGDRKRILSFTQFCMALQALVLFVLTLVDLIQVTHIMALAAFLGMVSAIESRARLGFLEQLAGHRRCHQAAAFHRYVLAVGAAIGPVIGGILIGLLDVAAVFLMNALTLLIVMTALSRIERADLYHVSTSPSPGESVSAGVGLHHLRRAVTEIPSFLLGGIVAAFGMSLCVLIPELARDTLFIGASGLGLMISVLGLSALLGRLLVRILPGRAYSRVLILGPACFVLLQLLLLATSGFIAFLPSIVGVLGLGLVTFTTIAIAETSLLRQEVPDEHMEALRFAHRQMIHAFLIVGSLFGGMASRFFGIPVVLWSGASVTSLATLACWWDRSGHGLSARIPRTASSATSRLSPSAVSSRALTSLRITAGSRRARLRSNIRAGASQVSSRIRSGASRLWSGVRWGASGLRSAGSAAFELHFAITSRVSSLAQSKRSQRLRHPVEQPEASVESETVRSEPGEASVLTGHVRDESRSESPELQEAESKVGPLGPDQPRRKAVDSVPAEAAKLEVPAKPEVPVKPEVPPKLEVPAKPEVAPKPERPLPALLKRQELASRVTRGLGGLSSAVASGIGRPLGAVAAGFGRSGRTVTSSIHRSGYAVGSGLGHAWRAIRSRLVGSLHSARTGASARIRSLRSSSRPKEKTRSVAGRRRPPVARTGTPLRREPPWKWGMARTGIDMGASSIKIVRCAGPTTPRDITHVGIEDWIPTGTDEDKSLAASALASLMRRLGLGKRQLGRVAVGVGGEKVALSEIVLPALSEGELKKALPFEAKRHLFLQTLDDPRLDFQILGPTRSEAEGEPPGMRVVLAAVSGSYRDAILEILARAGLEPEVIDLESLAGLNALLTHVFSGNGEDLAVGLLDLGARQTSLHLTHTRGGLLTRLVAPGFPRGKPQVLSAYLRDLITRIEETLTYYRAHHRKVVGRLYLSGGGAIQSELTGSLRESLNIPVEVFDPLRDGVSSIEGRETIAAHGPRLVTAYGLTRWWGAHGLNSARI